MYCQFCDKEVSTTIREVYETYPVYGEPTTIKATVRFCDECGADLFDEILDNNNLREAYKKYAVKHNLFNINRK